MAFLMPDLKGLAQRTRNAFRSETPGTDAWVWPNNIYVSAKVFAGVVYELFLRLRWIDKQRFAQTATLEGLLMMGVEYKLPLNGASQAQGNLLVAAPYPFSVPVGTQFTNSATGLVYASTQDAQALSYSSTGLISVPVVCQTAGKAGNLLAGTPLSTSLSGLTGGASEAIVDDSGLGGGADVEQTEAYRTRILARKAQPPMGGATFDYVAWAKKVPGVTRVFVGANAFGPGTVGVWFLMDDTYTNGIPQATDVATLQAYLNEVKPVTATVIVQAPQAILQNVVVGVLNPDTPAIRNAVAAELLAVFTHMTKPGLPSAAFTLYHSWLNAAVSNATGVISDEGVTTPPADEVFGVGALPVLSSVSFTPAP